MVVGGAYVGVPRKRDGAPLTLDEARACMAGATATAAVGSRGPAAAGPEAAGGGKAAAGAVLRSTAPHQARVLFNARCGHADWLLDTSWQVRASVGGAPREFDTVRERCFARPSVCVLAALLQAEVVAQVLSLASGEEAQSYVQRRASTVTAAGSGGLTTAAAATWGPGAAKQQPPAAAVTRSLTVSFARPPSASGLGGVPPLPPCQSRVSEGEEQPEGGGEEDGSGGAGLRQWLARGREGEGGEESVEDVVTALRRQVAAGRRLRGEAPATLSSAADHLVPVPAAPLLAALT